LSGAFKPQKGEVLVDGIPVSRISHRELAAKIAYVAQSNKIEYNFSVMDIVLMGRYAHIPFLRSESERDYMVTRNVMEQTGVAHLANRSILALSGGELQRVMLARALAQECSYLLLDEPVTGLDVRYQLDFLGLIASLCSQKQITAVCVMHDIELAYKYASKILLLSQGQIDGYGVPEDVITPESLARVYRVQSEIFNRNGRTHFTFS
ncbi:MAG TPA: ABC transporter ATP-binding protein, partial [Clostridia bacterium]|nr:ABC transporter ATP-binding protein [Clostridia bacterium]